MKPPRPQVNRRDLLRFRRSAEALEVDPTRTDAARRDERHGSADLLRASRPAMGSYFEIRIGANTPGATDLVGQALDLIDDLETQMTVYRDDSEVSRLNATAHLGPVQVEPGLFQLLERAVALSKATGGAYDVTSGALSLAWGFVKGPRRVPDPDVLSDALARTGSHHLILDAERRTVTFARPGVVINLGSIGKGYAIDRASGVIRDHWWPTTGIVHGGRSSVYAVGSPPGRFGDRWDVALLNPFAPDASLGMVRLRNRAMGTSGATFQKFTHEGREYGHILDPRTGEPAAGGPASVTVLAPTAAEADALSTAFYLLGPDAAAAMARERPELGVLFVIGGPADGSPRIRSFGLGPSDFVPAA